MRTHAVSVGTLLLVFIQLVIIESQRIREGRCPVVQRRNDCPEVVWDACTCDLDCQGIKKCCLDGCNYACLYPDFGTPSVRNNADVVFIMDSSGSIGKLDYKREKQFVKDLTNVFEVAPNATRVSTIIYSDYPKLIFDFNTYSDKRSINVAHDNLEYLGNRTRIDRALDQALVVFSESRPSVPRIAFVLTDGEQTEENDAKPLDVAVRPLHDLGVQVYVIGIGSYIKREELYLLARRRQDVFFVSSFEKLLRQTYRIVNQIDTVQDLIPPLQITADMLFLLDSSSAVPRLNYPKELEFLKKVVDLFRISPRYVRAGVIPYGVRAELSIPLGRHSTNEAINRSIDLLPYIGGQRRIERALILANQTFSEARPLVPKILLILTHGGALTIPGANLLTAVRALRFQGVSMFVISFGEDVNYATLGQIVQRKNLITDKSYDALEPYLPFAASYIRVNSDFTTPLDRNAAVVFLIDSTFDRVDKNDFKRQRAFVISLAKAFKIPNNGARVSVVTYGKDARPIVQFKDSGNFDSFLYAMMSGSSRMQGPRRMDRALRLAVRMFKDHLKPGPRAVVLFTSGPQDTNTSLSFLERPIKQLANLGARIHVVAIGSKVPYSQVSRLVNSSDDVFQISSFVRLQYEVHAIGRHISLTKGPRPPFIADIVFLVDSSGGIGSNNYKKQKEFVKTIAKALNLGEQYSRACLVVYSDGPRLVTNFNSHKTLREFGSALDRAPYLNRIRRIDKALEFGADLLRRARRDIPKVAILITSGARDSSNSLDVASNPLKAVGAKSFIVAIGNAPDIRELRLVVANNDDIFRVSSFRSLPGIEESFPKHIISSFLYSYGPEPELEELDDLDVIFLMDSSQPISFQAYRRQKTFIKSMVKHFNVSPGKSRVALVTYGSSASAEYLFGDTMFDQFVDGARFVGGVRRVDLAMQEAARLLSSTRQSVEKPVILLTGGNQEGGLSPDVAARMVRTRGGRPFVIMISREPDEAEFLKVVETSNHLFRVPSFERMELYAASLAKRIRGYVKEDPGPVPVPNYIADIVFVLDSSTGVSFSDYKKQIDFVKLLAQDLSISSRYSNAALVVYGEMAEEVLSFDRNRSLSDFETAIDNSPHLRGERRIDRALNETVRIMANARPSATKVVVLLTAGKQTSQSGGQSPGEAALPLLKNSVYNYVVAVGQEPDIAQLRPVVQDLSHIFRMASYDDLESQEPLVAHVIIDTSTSPKPITDIVSDIIFIMDSSSDVTREDYVRQKGFVKDIARYLKISAGRGARAAVITYGRNSSLLIKFGGYGTLLSFDEAVDSAPFVGGRRRMDLALKDAELLLSEARPDEAKWVILLTAGGQSTSSGVKTLEEASKPVREKSDKVYVVTIGNKMDIRKIQDVVSDPKDIFSVPSAEGLKSQTRLIANAIVKGHNDSDFRVVKTFKADIVFLVDTSSSVGSLHFRSQKQFVKSMAKSLNVAPGKSRAAIVTYGASSDRSDMHASLSTFEEAVDSSRYIRGRRRTHLAVNDADSLLQTSRPDAQKVVVLLSGGRESSSQDIATLKQSFRTLRASGTKIFVIAIGSNYNEEDFFPAVERFEDIFTVSSFDTLVSQAWLTSKSIAERTDLLVPRSFQADILFIMDSSADVSREDYEKEKDFVVTLAKYLRLSPGGTRAGLLTYGYTPTLVANYDSYDRLEMFKNATYKAPYIGGSRRIDETFYSASQLIPSARKLLPKIIIFLAAGKQEIGYSFDLEASKRKLQNHGAKMYLVAIGDGPSSDELYPVVKEKYVHRVPSFDYLQRNALAIAQEVGKQEDPKIPENFVGGDVVLIVDSSSDVSPFEFEKEKEFVKALTGA
ncbi:collagen alpha-3(VI) chain-like [Montipora foliosa]|uniref:collagen alpha-3(VI) chain-like n=1 Tax=Montipora foliosa TaxID=591990 RepID=UPI0035F11871